MYLMLALRQLLPVQVITITICSGVVMIASRSRACLPALFIVVMMDIRTCARMVIIMRLRLRFYCLLLVLSCFGLVLHVCSIDALRAYAVEPVYRQMTVQEAYEFYGDSLDVIYYSTQGYKHATLNKSVNGYSYNKAGSEFVGTDIPSWLNNSDLKYVVYGAALSDYSLDPSYLGVNISPNVNFSNCNALRFCAAGYLANTTVSSAAYDASFIKVFGQTELTYTNSPYTSNGVFPYWRIDRGNGDFRILPVWCDYSSDTLSTVSLMQIGFNGVRLDGQRLNIYLSCPLVNDTAVSGTGVVTGTAAPSTGTDINVNVDVDLHETNGLLSGIIDAVDGLIDGLIGLFVPSEEDLESWCDDMDDLLHDHLGGMYEAVDLIEDTYNGYGSVTAVQSIHVDACNVPLAGATLTLGNWDVPLKTEALPTVFYDALAYIIDFLTVAAFINMLRRKLEIILNPDSEVVETDG